MNLPYMHTPCRDCPFRKDTLKGWLGERRMTEIVEASTFPCHKTIGNRKQCAGHMLLKGAENEFVAMAGIMKIELDLKGRELVFDNEQECINHHKHG